MDEHHQKVLDKIDTSRWEFSAQHIIQTIRKNKHDWSVMIWLQKILKRQAQEAFILGYSKARSEMEENFFAMKFNNPDFASLILENNSKPIKLEDK